jgi:hypothetical protein
LCRHKSWGIHLELLLLLQRRQLGQAWRKSWRIHCEFAAAAAAGGLLCSSSTVNACCTATWPC